jgi:hypothetical protein
MACTKRITTITRPTGITKASRFGNIAVFNHTIRQNPIRML